MAQKLKFVLAKRGIIAEKGENPCHQHFFLFPTIFSKGLLIEGQFTTMS